MLDGLIPKEGTVAHEVEEEASSSSLGENDNEGGYANKEEQVEVSLEE